MVAGFEHFFLPQDASSLLLPKQKSYTEHWHGALEIGVQMQRTWAHIERIEAGKLKHLLVCYPYEYST
jgi:hypothetical protein